MRIKPKRYIVWSTERDIDLSDPWQRRWYIKQVLVSGRAKDVADLDWEEIRNILYKLELPEDIKSLWEDYFASQG